jgi:hypothetical protein
LCQGEEHKGRQGPNRRAKKGATTSGATALALSAIGGPQALPSADRALPTATLEVSLAEAAERRLGNFVRSSARAPPPPKQTASFGLLGGTFIPALDLPQLPTFSLLRGGSASTGGEAPVAASRKPSPIRPKDKAPPSAKEEALPSSAFGPGGVEAFEVVLPKGRKGARKTGASVFKDKTKDPGTVL